MDQPPLRICVVIPSHNHWRAMPAIVERLRAAGLEIIIVDDGSDEPARQALHQLGRIDAGVEVLRLDQNGGKGAAVIEGLRRAASRGFTHALQIDADGQHDLAALEPSLKQALLNPAAMVTGQAVYDRSVPLGRKIGRWITHFWVWVETLSLRIPDTMCGFRIYPLASVQRLLESGVRIGRHMQFDPEIAVRLFWGGTPVVSIPVKVIYPPENTSNFRMLADNVRISLMHTRLVFTLLFNLPRILRSRPPVIQERRHWAWMAERGAYFGLLFCAGAYRLLGRRGCLCVLAPIVLYFYATGAHQRRASKDFLNRVYAFKAAGRTAGFIDSYRHFFSFAARTLDTFIAWVNAPRALAVVRGIDGTLREAEASAAGALFIISHQGSVDVARAVLDETTRKRLTILVHTRHAQNYANLLRRFRPEAVLDMMEVSELGPEAAIALQQKVDAGQWIVIAGDRTPITGERHVSTVPFLGRDAPFPTGPYVLAALLDCPVYALFCLREGDHFRLDVHQLADRIVLPRRDRAEALKSQVLVFAKLVEDYALREPFQWYNFFPFWASERALP